MFYIKEIKGNNYYIVDTKDSRTDVCDMKDIINFVNLGIEIKGVSVINGKLDISVFDKGIITEDITVFDTAKQRQLRSKIISYAGAYRFVAVVHDKVKGSDKDYYDYHVLENKVTGERMLVESKPLVMFFVNRVLRVKFKAEDCDILIGYGHKGLKVVDLPIIEKSSYLYKECRNYLTEGIDLPMDKPENFKKKNLSIRNCRVKYENLISRECIYFNTKALVDEIEERCRR